AGVRSEDRDPGDRERWPRGLAVDPDRARDPAAGRGGPGRAAEPAQPGRRTGRGDRRPLRGAGTFRPDGPVRRTTVRLGVTGRRHRTADSTTRSPSTNRDGRSGRRSNVSLLPSATSSAIARPAAGACISPCPPNPTQWKRPGTAGSSPTIAWWSGVSG